ncbi:class I SAM-dependent methyltransferase [Peribacillus sp. B-H-3]|uniref:class I SAM-dependent methyltransferase n=1 Tax=Peribacillus sp. B-H-3 TaxID=3400420 RepID=UPI003B021A4D
MFVTTPGRTDEESIAQAKLFAAEMGLSYVPRNKQSIRKLQEITSSDCLVLGKERYELYRLNEREPFFFHPNLASIRIKRLEKGEQDAYLAAAGIAEGSEVLDCTLGLGSDAIVASYAAGAKGRITAIEENPYLSLLVEKGLSEWKTGSEKMDQAMKRIEVKTAPHLKVLEALPDNSYDVVYFDPMFEVAIKESSGIQALAFFASRHGLTRETVWEAKRVARKRVVLKDHYKSSRFNEFGFQTVQRKTSKFHFGFMDIKE